MLPTLKVKKLDPRAKLPTCAHPGEDLAFDLYALDNVRLYSGKVTRIRTGIAIEFFPAAGALIRDRSSMASAGFMISGGVIDAGYRGEIIICMTLFDPDMSRNEFMMIDAGEKIAQMIPVAPNTLHAVQEVEELGSALRGVGGFGSTGK